MSATLVVGPGAIVTSSGRVYCVRRFDTADTVIARDIETGADKPIRLSDLTTSSMKDEKKQHIDLVDFVNETDGGDERWAQACEDYRAVRPILESKSSRNLVESIAQERQVSTSTLYRWVKDFRETGVVSAFLRKTRKDAGTKRLDERTEELISKVLVNRFLKSQKLKVTKTFRDVVRLCRRLGIPEPHFNTFAQRVRALSPELKAKTREGYGAALKFRATRGSFPGADQAFAVLQIDHTPADVILVDEVHRLPIGRPWITMAIHVQSRLVAGWYVSFDPPGTLGTGMCLANAILPKEPQLAGLGVDHPWPIQGLPAYVHADNAKEFRGNTLKLACQEWGFDLKYRKIKKPNYGGHIERYLGTLLAEIQTLSGTTFSNPKERKNYDSEKEANMTLKEFEQWLAQLILGTYHHRVHSALGVTPLKRYHDLVMGSDEHPGVGSLPIVTDAEKLRIDFLPFEYRTIQTYGVQIDGIEYYADVLRRWVGAADPKRTRAKRKFIFRRDPRDISYVYFYDPDAKRYFRLPYRDLKRPPISLWELRAVQRFLAKQGKKNADEETIFKAFDRMREIEEQSKESTRKMRLEQERRRHHRQAAPLLPPEPTTDSVPEPAAPYDPAAIVPFEEVEDS